MKLLDVKPLQVEVILKNSAIWLGILAGLLGTLGSLLGKLAGNSEGVITVMLIGASILFNTAGCTAFLKALSKSPSSVTPLAVNTAANYFCSALVGIILFQESVSIIWWLGAVLILLGVIFMAFEEAPLNSEEAKRK